MKLPRLRLRSLLILIALVAMVMAGVATALRIPRRPYSSVYAGFDPVALLSSASGYYSVRGVSGWNVFNAVDGYAYKEWRGVVTGPIDPSVPGTIQKSIEDYLSKASQGKCHTEGTLAGNPDEAPQSGRLPSHAVFMFNEREWHGDMHVWLFPDSSGWGIGYAIFLREERLR